MPVFKRLAKAVLGFDRAATLNGRPVPQSVRGLKAIAVAYDRRLGVGIFEMRRKNRRASCRYRLVVWRTYRDGKTKRERASTTVFRDEIDPIVRLVAQCGDRFGKGE